MIQDCQEKVFSAYKAFKRARSSESSIEVMQRREDSIAKIQTKLRETTPNVVSTAFESAPLQNNDQENPFLTYSTNVNPQHNGQTPQERSFSDSAYGTQVYDCFDYLTSGLCTCSLSSSSNQLQDWPSITHGPSQWPSNEQCFSVNLSSYDRLVLQPEISGNECSQGNEQPLKFGSRVHWVNLGYLEHSSGNYWLVKQVPRVNSLQLTRNRVFYLTFTKPMKFVFL